jgi:hypothetical protein
VKAGWKYAADLGAVPGVACDLEVAAAGLDPLLAGGQSDMAVAQRVGLLFGGETAAVIGDIEND